MLAPKKGLLCNLNHIHLQHISLGLHLSRHPELQETAASPAGDQSGRGDCPENREQVDANSNNPSFKCRCCESHAQQPETLGLLNQAAQEGFPCLHAGEEAASPCDLASSTSSSSSVSSCSDFSLDDSPVSVYCKGFSREGSQSPENQPTAIPIEDAGDGRSPAEPSRTCDGRDANLNPPAPQSRDALAGESPDSLCSSPSPASQRHKTSPGLETTRGIPGDLDPNCNPLPEPDAAPAAPPAPARDAGKKNITSFHELAQKRKRNAGGAALAQARADRSDWLIVFSPDTELPPPSELLASEPARPQPQHDGPAKPPGSRQREVTTFKELRYRSAANKPKAQLGDSRLSPDVGHLLLRTLCPALYAVVEDGLKPFQKDVITGQRRNSPWSVVEASVKTGRGPLPHLADELLLLIQPLSVLTFHLDLLFEHHHLSVDVRPLSRRLESPSSPPHHAVQPPPELQSGESGDSLEDEIPPDAAGRVAGAEGGTRLRWQAAEHGLVPGPQVGAALQLSFQHVLRWGDQLSRAFRGGDSSPETPKPEAGPRDASAGPGGWWDQLSQASRIYAAPSKEKFTLGWWTKLRAAAGDPGPGQSVRPHGCVKEAGGTELQLLQSKAGAELPTAKPRSSADASGTSSPEDLTLSAGAGAPAEPDGRTAGEKLKAASPEPRGNGNGAATDPERDGPAGADKGSWLGRLFGATSPSARSFQPSPDTGSTRSRAVRALCDHTGSADGHLSFQKGDVLQLLSTVDEDWIRCCRGNSTGLVPVGYTSLIL
ncbi:Rusc1 [Columba guinea]|nr:Rusc1 [Columba guinea]